MVWCSQPTFWYSNLLINQTECVCPPILEWFHFNLSSFIQFSPFNGPSPSIALFDFIIFCINQGILLLATLLGTKSSFQKSKFCLKVGSPDFIRCSIYLWICFSSVTCVGQRMLVRKLLFDWKIIMNYTHTVRYRWYC